MKDVRMVSPGFKQFVGCAAPHFGAMSVGVTFGFSAVALPQLFANDTTVHVTKDLGSWIASIFPLTVAFGCLFSGIILEYFGRKKTHIISSIFAVIGWIWISLSKTALMIIIGRVITGLGTGIGRTSYGIYVSEISTPKYRGVFLCLNNSFLCLGFLYSHIIGTYIHWMWLAMLSALPSLFCMLIMTFCPESPVWLLNQDKTEEAQEVFVWYRGNSIGSRAEMSKYLQVLQQRHSSRNMIAYLTENIGRPEVWKSLIIVIVIFTSLQATGSSAISAYTVEALTSTIPSVDAYAGMIALDIMRVIASCICFFLTEKLNRRTLVSIGNFGCAFFLFLLAFCTYHQEENIGTQIGKITSLLLYMWFCVMIFQTTWTVTNELYPHDMKGAESGIAACINFLLNFATVKTYYLLVDTLGISGLYIFYGVAITLCGIFLMIFLPETKNRTLLDIEEYFMGIRNEQT